MSYYDGRKQRHVPYWWWCSRTLAGPLYKKYSMTFIWGHPLGTYGSYGQFFNPLGISLCAHIYVFKVLLSFTYVISSIWYPIFWFWLCLFGIVSSRCFTSKNQKLWFSLSSLIAFLVFKKAYFITTKIDKNWSF